MSLIIGTAGHIDHGKTALIKAINGFEGDTLKAEKERGITIDLSFSNLKQNNKNIAFIDVPGHENLLKTMISGAFGFDACLFVIAANEGIKPQSIEHLKVLSILNVKNIILAITKKDLVQSEQINILKSQIQKEIQKYKNLTIIKSFEVSIFDKNSIKELTDFLFTIKPKITDESGIFRYYIDRSFNLKGIGQVVTGTVIEGSIKEGEKIWICELAKEAGIRSIQVHDNQVEKATISQRAALNITGISGLEKGQLISKKGFLRGFNEIDCIVTSDSLKHASEVIFCVGSKQLPAKVTILSQKDDSKFVTFKFQNNVFLKFNELFVLLYEGRVIGGGRVLNAITEPLKKPVKVELLRYLSENNLHLAFDLLKRMHKNGFGLIGCYQRFGIDHKQAITIANTLNSAFVDEKALNVYDISAINKVKEFIRFILSKNPYAIFSPLSISLKLAWVSENLALQAINELNLAKEIEQNNGVYTKTGIDFSKLKTKIEDEIYNKIQKANLSPLAPYNIYDELEIDRVSGDNALKKLTASNKVIRLSHNLFVSKKALDEAIIKLKEIAKKEGKVNIQNAKSIIGLSRKYIIAYLEQLDKQSDIVKDGNDRKLKF